MEITSKSYLFLFYYITPSGVMVKEKLVAPQEVGKYEVGMAVRDEYGAWSDYYVQYIDAGKVAAPNTPPDPGFTSTHINTFRGVEITFDSFASDKEDGDRTMLPHEYYVSNKTLNTPESLMSTSRTSWKKIFTTLGKFNIRQVVEDSLGVTAQYELQVNIVNRLPKAVVTTPSSTDQTKPTKFDTTTPTFTWTYSDADGDEQKQYQLRIYRYGGVIQSDTNTRAGSVVNFTPNADLPEKVNMYVVVRVYDGYDWSEWSTPKFFYIETNRPPIAQFDWKPKPVWEGDVLQLVNQSSDPDGDTISSLWTVTAPSGNVRSYTETPLIANAEPGNYTISLEVSDGELSAGTSSIIEVLPLTIEADVRHTDEWKKIHDREGHETIRNPKDFYAGEVIIANARPTAGVPVKQVTVKLVATGLDGRDLTREWQMSATGSADVYAAELFDTKWASLQEGLPQGRYNLKFTVIYSNGTTKTTTVPIQIIGSVYKAVGVHRRQ